MKRRILLSLVTCCVSYCVHSQSFSPSASSFSSKKTAYINLDDGTRLEGTIEEIDRKKGLIDEITIKPSGSRKKSVYKSEQIRSMYLPISGMENLANRIDEITDINTFSSPGVNIGLINKGYALFETTIVRIKKKDQPMLLQLLNPSFCSRIMVFSDPVAGETSRPSIDGLQPAEENPKSYYVQIGAALAEQLKSKSYEKKYSRLYKGCPSLLAKRKAKPNWSDFSVHLYEFTTKCK